MARHRPFLSSLAAAGLVAVLVVPVLGGAAPSRGGDSGVTNTGSHAEARPPDTYVAAWDAIGVQAVSAAGLPPPDGHVVFAYVAVAVYDSVMAVERDYRPFAVRARAPKGTSAEAAVATAAHHVLAPLPARAGDDHPRPGLRDVARRDPRRQGEGRRHRHRRAGRRRPGSPSGRTTASGIRAPTRRPDPPIPGVWLPTAATPPIGVTIGDVRPFVLRSADQFRPEGPPALPSKRWARDYNEVKEIGSATSTTRSAEQTLAARFWAEPPVPQARASFRKFVLDHGLDIVEASRFMAMVSVGYADAVIACFEAKYHTPFWRPITAVRAGDTDGNAATVGDATWSPLLPATPNHPEYPSAHSCITPVAGIVVERFLGTHRIDFTVPSVTGLGDRTFATTRDLQDDVSNARVYGGIHYRSAVEDGAVIARKAANYVLRHAFGKYDD